MGAVAPPTHWVPRDDFLLKNAVEAGASLESLAKGAVKFSRRYTVQELQDRWCSLLYDPVVSVKASEHMLDFEYSASIHPSRSNNMGAAKEITLKSRKRKGESVRKCYYAMRKRICHTPFAMMDGKIPSGPVTSNFGDRNILSSADMMIDKPVLYNFGNQEGPNLGSAHGSYSKYPTCATECTGNGDYAPLEPVQYIQNPVSCGNMASENFCHPRDSNVPLLVDNNVVIRTGQSKESPSRNLLGVYGLKNDGSACSEFGCAPFRSFVRSSSLPQMPNWDTDPGISAIGSSQNIDPAEADESPNYGLAISDLKNPISCDDMKIITPSMEDYFEELSSTLFDFSNDEELLLDKSYLNGFSSLLSESPYDNELPNVSLGEASVAARGNVVLNVKVFGPEYRDGVICCTLNSEDPEIPSNDDVFLPFRFPSPPKTLGDHWKSYDMPPSVDDFSSARKASGISRWPKTNQNNSYEQSRIIKPLNPSKKVLNDPNGDRRVKFELPSSSIQHVGLRNALNIGGPSIIRSENVNLNHTVSGVVKGGPCLDKHSRGPDILQSIERNGSGCRNELDSKVMAPNAESSNFVASSVKTTATKSIEKSQLSDQEEILTENAFDMPYFSDVEAMILDMDLSPDECGLLADPEVNRFHHEETKKTIIRLEQATCAYMQRAIAAQGAFAVLYGRHRKHFIKKTEVLLGRSTEDVKVDIDLGREREGGKISRRQASIKMDSCGWFHLKNLGKCLIHVNGIEVGSEESQVLTSGCLIQVRGLAFMFETSETRIKQHVNSTTRGNFCSDRKLFINS
ncbi:uncharacterized protein [Primulina eburnea]|uniref:uncharacterized protein n=1 Tax=Primulina eburnea TaxID=1245227 RepID=UPI003C6C180D